MGRYLLAAAGAAVLIFAAPAAAVVYVEGTGEPAFTRSTTNTQWVKWQGSSAYEAYRIEFDYFVNNQFNRTATTGNVTPNGTGTMWANWQGVVEPLQEGSTYGICTYGRYWIGGIPTRDTGSCFDADQNGKRASTTIDLTKPTIAVKIDNGAAFSKTANLWYRIDYSDNLAFPFPANFICRDVGSDPAQACNNVTHQFNEACSVPAGGMKKVTWFDCSEDLAAANVGDGPVTLCVVAADSAIPDNPSSSNQGASAASANLSDRVCDSITIDRTAPAASVAASETTVMVGDLVSFTAQASDGTSGLSGNYAWTWGDNTAGGAGSSATHTFTAPGTYEVTVKTADNAGNETTAKQVVTVQPRPTEGGGTPSGGGTNTGGGTTGGGSTGGSTGGTAGGSTGGTATPAPQGLRVQTVKQLKLQRRTRSLPVVLTATGPGMASITLRRAGRSHAQRAVTMDEGTRKVRLKLPRGLRAGTYALEVEWEPANVDKTTSTTRRVRFVAATRRAVRAKASAASARQPLVTPEGAPVDVPTGEMPAARSIREVVLPLR